MLTHSSFPDLGPFKDTQVSQVSPLSTMSGDEENSCFLTERENNLARGSPKYTSREFTPQAQGPAVLRLSMGSPEEVG